MTAHAKLSCSGSKKWISCPASIRLEAAFPNETSVHAAAGTLCHELGELRLTQEFLGKTVIYERDKYDGEMFSAVQFYLDAVKLLIAEYGNGEEPVAMLEVQLDLTRWIPDGFGTADCVIVFPRQKLVIVADLKYGKGVLVEAAGNSQLRLYGAGVLDLLSLAYDVERIVTVVIQPRRNHVDREELGGQELLDWMDTVVAPAVAATELADAPAVPGDHCHDGFCRARHTCAARAAEATAAFTANDKIPGLLTPEEVAKLLPVVGRIANWAKGLADFAQEQAVKYGQEYPGYKLVEGRSYRVWSDENAVASVLVEEGGLKPDDIWTRKLIGITDAERLVGKDHPVFNLAVKPPGKPTLVPVSDKRQPYNGGFDQSAFE